MLKDAIGAYDTIVWSEGLEQLRDPILPFRAVLAHLAPGGRAFIEVTHGTNGPCPVKINAWRPTPQGFETTLKLFPDVRIVNTKKGRKDLRTVYVLESTKVVPPPHPPVVPVTIVELKADPVGPIREAAGEPTKIPTSSELVKLKEEAAVNAAEAAIVTTPKKDKKPPKPRKAKAPKPTEPPQGPPPQAL